MARILVQYLRNKLHLAITLLLVIVVMSTNVFPALAAHYNGWFTGYAMGNRYGGAGVEIRLGHFANHWFERCPSDPSAWWTWGTQIKTDNSIITHSRQGGSVARYWFSLYDVGDFSCSMGNYWVDIYFGRWENKSTSNSTYCHCPGVTSPGYCISASVSSCTDATNFGVSYRGYTGP